MAKVKTTFFCQNCGTSFAKWQGQCTACKEWNTIAEEVIQKAEKVSWKVSETKSKRVSKSQKVKDISTTSEARLNTKNNELNRVLGGGIVPGSLTLLGGEPGIGKSTLMLQIALQLPYKTLYVSGEESAQQIKMRAERIHPGSEESSPGSISQIRETTTELIKFAKETNTPVVLIGHITKDGNIAGPKILEHMVDTVLQFEGDRNHVYRILRSQKNRFGSTNELGIYEMQGNGLREVSNPSEILISKNEEDLSGTAISATLEGMRPLMIEIQALVSTAVYGTPQRSATGYNAKRLNMLLAVLEKRAGFKLGAKDVFLNVTGGITVDDPAIDLAVVAAVLSSNIDISIDKSMCFAAEIGLAGEVRPVTRVDQRISEAEKLGFKSIVISKYCKIPKNNYTINIIKVAKVHDVVKHLFG